MSVGDVLKVVLSSTYQGIACENIWHYLVDVSNGANESVGLSGAFQLSVITPLVDIVSTELEFTALSVVNLDNPTDTNLAAGLATFGDVAGDNTNAFMAWGFIMTTLDPAVGDGSKRIAGVAEQSVTNGVATLATAPFLNTVATAFATTLLAPGVATGEYLPAVASLDDTGAVIAVGAIEGASYVRVTTQNSRKT